MRDDRLFTSIPISIKIEEGDIDEARKEAEREAYLSLAGVIRTEVKASFESRGVRKYEGRLGSRGKRLTVSESVHEEMHDLSKVSTYSQAVLREPRFELFPDYKPGYFTVVAKLTKATYRKIVDKQIAADMDTVTGSARHGLRALRKGSYAVALGNLATTEANLDKLFPDSTFRRDLDGDGEDDNVRGLVEDRLREMLSRIRIEPQQEAIKYRLNGELLAKPRIRASYMAGRDHVEPVLGLKLEATTEPEQGRFDSRDASTAADGTAAIALVSVPGTQRSATLRVELAEDLPTGFPRPFCTISLRRLPVVCLAVLVDGSTIEGVPAELVQQVHRQLKDSSFEVLPFELRGKRVSQTDLDAATERGADRLLAVILREKVGDDGGLPYAEVRIDATMRDLTTSEEAMAVQNAAVRRYAGDARAAASAVLPSQIKTFLGQSRVALQLAARRPDPDGYGRLLAEKREDVAKLATRAAQELADRHFVGGLEDLLAAQRLLDAVAPNSTFEADVAAARVDVRSWVTRELRALVQSIEVRPERASWEFDRRGELRLYPKIIARVGDGPLRGLPLEVVFAKGEGNVEPRMVTDNNGLATVQVRSVKPECKEAVLVARIDRPMPSAIRRPPCRIVLERVKGVACELDKEIDRYMVEKALRRAGYEPLSAKENPDDTDYRLRIVMEGAESAEEDRVLTVKLSARAEMVSSDGKLAFSVTVGPEPGYGTNAEQARADALAHVREKLPDALDLALAESREAKSSEGTAEGKR